jgi:indole-3-glycerol phosphate synthase
LYEPANVPRVIEAGAALVGINNRDLRTFETDLGHTIRVRGELPDDCVVVAESGIHSRADVERLESAGIDAMLVGEHFMVADDIGAAVDSLLRRKP